MTKTVYYCTYCEFYTRNQTTGTPTGLPPFTGTRREVVAHADAHPIGDPRDMAQIETGEIRAMRRS